MHDYSDSTDRKPIDFLLFGMGFVGFLFGTAGVVLASKFLAALGAAMLLLAVVSFRLRAAP